MLESFYVINDTGIGIYEYIHPSRREEAKIEFQLLAGLISALINFSKTTLMDNIQVISLTQGKLVFTVDPRYPLRYGIGIFSKDDHDVVAKKACRKILTAFNKKYPPTYLTEGVEVPIDQNQINFNPLSALYYKPRVPMTIDKSILRTLVVSFIGLIAYFLAYYFYPSEFDNFFIYGINSQKTYYLIVIYFGIPYLLFGFFTGNRYLGLLSTSIINTVFTTIIFLTYHMSLSQMRIDGIDFTYFLAMVLGFLGGYFAELFFLSKKAS